jgi:peptidyl-dipeptidase Dcp
MLNRTTWRVRIGLAAVACALALGALARAQAPAQTETNPLLKPWTTPFEVPPFQEIKPEHFVPAYKVAIALNRKEIDAIVGNPQPATFANTIEALDKTGQLLSKVSSVFGNLSSAQTTPELQAINREITPLQSALRDDIRLNATLFARVKTVWENREKANLTPEQKKLVDDTYKSYVRGGANLDPRQKERLRAINSETAMLSLKFGDNLLHDTGSFRLVVDKQEDLAGLPAPLVAAAADTAKKAGLPGQWVFTLDAPSIWPFVQSSPRRALREQMTKAYTTRGDHNDQWDNKAVITKIAALRAERAVLLGYKTHADYVLEENMAKTPAQVYALLNQVWGPAVAAVGEQKTALLELARKEGGPSTIEPWDWRYYAEKLKKAQYDVDQEALRPYFKLENVREGAFYVANKLYGLTFTERPDVPVPNPDVKAFEVKEADGTLAGLLYTDYPSRTGSKRVGAWSSSYRSQQMVNGKRIVPIVVNVCNFPRATGDGPVLLSIEEASTLFHEFGHALNSLLSRVPYRGLGGTPRDFVELPSQIMENWATEPEVLKVYAKHYKTGQVIPVDLVQKIQKASRFDEAFNQVEYLAASILDMDWHTQSSAPADPTAFENQSMAKIHNPREIVPRYRSTYFNHIWNSGYSAGYYSYVWCQVLDADAFQAFKEKGNLFDQATALSFRRNVLEKGGSEDAMALYKRFRGREPNADALLIRLGFKKATSN